MAANLSDYIRDDLRARILSASRVPEKLSLPALARLYGVSMMPVRIAVQGLLEEGILLREEGRRLRANPERMGRRRSSAAPKPPRSAFDGILAGVLKDSLRGRVRGMKIVPHAERHGISGSKVHAIFHRLAGMGLLDHSPRRGWSVRPFRGEDLDAYIAVRERLELLALDLAAPRLERGRLEELLALNRPGGGGGAGIDNSLHRYWVEESGNRYIQDFFARHQMYYDALLSHAVLERAHIEASRRSHCRILEAMLRRDWAAARSELVADIRRLRPLLRQTVQRLKG